jgi:transposase-like protein
LEVERKLERAETRLEVETQTQLKKAVKDGNEKMIQLYGEMVIETKKELVELRRELVELRRELVELRRELVELRKEKNKLIPESTGIIH